MQRFFNLEKVIGRAPLGIRFLDLVRGVSVNDVDGYPFTIIWYLRLSHLARSAPLRGG